MTYTLKDLKHLEVMAKLANSPAKSLPKINIQTFMTKDKCEQTMDEKILSLCSLLRNEGFVKQAENLESKFVMYKSANVHLYRVFDENGEDVINFAHPDGDMTMSDAEQDLGDVETIVSQHKKIVDMINKVPTGKLASYLEKCKNILNKNATIIPWAIGLAYWRSMDNINQGILQNSNDLISNLTSLLDNDKIKNLPTSQANIKEQIESLKELQNFTQKYNDMRARTATQDDLIFIQAYGRKIVNEIEPSLKKLYKQMNELERQDEESISSKVWRSIVKSDFTSTKQAIGGLWKAILDMTSNIKSLMAELAVSKQNKQLKNDEDESILSGYSPSMINEDSSEFSSRTPSFQRGEISSKEHAISELNSTLTTLTSRNLAPAKQQQAATWILSQIKEFQDTQDPKKISELILENKEFEQQLKVLEGKK